MRPQEVGQREASGRRQREVHPQQLQGGSEPGAAEPCGRAPVLPWLSCQPSVSALSLETKVQGSWALPGWSFY